jgi:hypothetical protein
MRWGSPHGGGRGAGPLVLGTLEDGSLNGRIQSHITRDDDGLEISFPATDMTVNKQTIN